MVLSPTNDLRFNHGRWINQISKILEKEIWIDIDVAVSIFRVPKSITIHKPDAYEPRVVGLGPYHHFNLELYEMERYKLLAAGRLQKQVFHNVTDFKDLIQSLSQFEYKVRASYHKYLDFDVETLTWVMTIDSMFLLEFLYFHTHADAGQSQLVKYAAGRLELTFDAILGDVMMLENQIPIFFMRETLFALSSNRKVSDEMLASMLLDFCKLVSPVKFEDRVLNECDVLKRSHLLDLLYHFIVPKTMEQPDMISSDNLNGRSGSTSYDRPKSTSSDSTNDHDSFRELFDEMLDVASDVKRVNKIAAPIQAVMPMFSELASRSDQEQQHPMVDEIMIPSVSRLVKTGIQFCPMTSGGIESIKFDEKTRNFYLPVITLNNNTDVVIRNLVAYEASVEAGPLVLSRYIELMHGIIDTAEDAKILRESGIIVNNLKSDVVAAEMFNGVTKSVRLTNVSHIDKVIEDVNKYVNNKMRVQIHKRFKRFIYRSWRLLTVVAIILLILMMILQSFCSIYNCPRVFNTISED
ncbi:putative UPF0481 protein At3g02645 [Impatiens glandulifera]|uniref:putative UPF0481 protein At3g02645 n=1 Tax=Impatiens glandulifera TaxID=253017 RepID=UPI001FB11D20|nr:putative UPF0481 protein At3g02645 [Impatiens glandulifera]